MKSIVASCLIECASAWPCVVSPLVKNMIPILPNYPANTASSDASSQLSLKDARPAFSPSGISPAPKRLVLTITLERQEHNHLISSGEIQIRAKSVSHPRNRVPAAHNLIFGSACELDQHNESHTSYSDTSLVQQTIEVCVYTDLEDDKMYLVRCTLFAKIVSTRNLAHTHLLPKNLYDVGKALLNAEDFVSAVLNSRHLYGEVVDRIMADIATECIHLCEKKNFSSVLSRTTPKDLSSCCWTDLIKEWQKEAPLFLRTITAPSSFTGL